QRFYRLSGPVPGGIFGILLWAYSRAHRRRCSCRRAPPFRFRERADHPGRGPRPNRRASSPVRTCYRIRRQGECPYLTQPESEETSMSIRRYSQLVASVIWMVFLAATLAIGSARLLAKSVSTSSSSQAFGPSGYHLLKK